MHVPLASDLWLRCDATVLMLRLRRQAVHRCPDLLVRCQPERRGEIRAAFPLPRQRRRDGPLPAAGVTRHDAVLLLRTAAGAADGVEGDAERVLGVREGQGPFVVGRSASIDQPFGRFVQWVQRAAMFTPCTRLLEPAEAAWEVLR